MTEKKNNPSAGNTARKIARLVAVQALYQAKFEEEPLKDIIRHALDEADVVLNGDEALEGEAIMGRPDPELLSQIVNGVILHRETLEEMLKGALDQRFSAGRMEILLRGILLAGAYELHHTKVPHKIIISDYVDVAHAFFNAKEPGLVNAVLDRLAERLRS